MQIAVQFPHIDPIWLCTASTHSAAKPEANWFMYTRNQNQTELIISLSPTRILLQLTHSATEQEPQPVY